MNEDVEHRKDLLDVLLKLAIKSEEVPKCLLVSGITNVSQFPIASGGFGDIRSGQMGNRKVALKTLRYFPEGERYGTLHKVRNFV